MFWIVIMFKYPKKGEVIMFKDIYKIAIGEGRVNPQDERSVEAFYNELANGMMVIGGTHEQLFAQLEVGEVSRSGELGKCRTYHIGNATLDLVIAPTPDLGIAQTLDGSSTLFLYGTAYSQSPLELTGLRVAMDSLGIREPLEQRVMTKNAADPLAESAD